MDLSISSLSKGQTFMPDYMASLVIFGILMGIFLSSWNLITTSGGSETEMLQARHTSTFLVATEGYPENWENESIEPRIPGFAQGDHVIDPEKLGSFRGFSYETQRELLQTPEYYLEFRNGNGTLELNGRNASFGRNYSEASQIYPVTRTVLVNKSGNLVDAEMMYVSWE